MWHTSLVPVLKPFGNNVSLTKASTGNNRDNRENVQEQSKRKPKELARESLRSEREISESKGLDQLEK